jgi:hypothetical protein
MMGASEPPMKHRLFQYMVEFLIFGAPYLICPLET